MVVKTKIAMKKMLLLLSSLIGITASVVAQGNWQLIANTQFNFRIDDIYFTNDSVGYVGGTGNGVYKTNDRGNTWNYIAPPNIDIFRSIEFINDTIGFYGLLSSTPTMPGALFKTTNAGINWTQIQNMQMQDFDGICGIAHFQNSVIAVGTYSGPAWFYRSDDAGLNWTKTNLSAFASGLVDCYMINQDTILVSGIAESGNQQKATILKSYNGGLSWQRVFLASAPTTYCWKMFFRPNGLGLSSIEGASAIARTTDFGSTWSEQLITNPQGMEFGAIGLLNDTLGWVSNQWGTGTWETHDGGLTWDSINSIIQNGDRMVVIDSTTALIAGAGIYKYVYNVTGIETPIVAKKIHSLQVYPNPASQNITINAVAGTPTFGLIDILDEKGVVIKQLTRQHFIQGKTTFEISVIDLPAANYKMLWRNNELFLTTDFVIIK